MNISEPTTMLTDYALGVLCLIWGWKLLRPANRRHASQAFWARAFFATGLAALLGGTVHGFALIFRETLIMGLWRGTLYLTGFASFFMMAAIVLVALPRTLSRWGLAVCGLKLVVYLVWMFHHQDFRFVVYDYGSALFLILGFQLVAFYKQRSVAAGWIALGILFSLVGTAIQQSGLSLDTHFNHNDLFHVVQMGAFYLFYRGGLLLTPTAQNREPDKQPKRTNDQKENGCGEGGERVEKSEGAQVGQREGISGVGSQTLKEFGRERGSRVGRNGRREGVKGGVGEGEKKTSRN